MADHGRCGERVGWIWRVGDNHPSTLIHSSSRAARLATVGCVCCLIAGRGPGLLSSRRVRRLSSVSLIVAFASVSDSRPARKWYARTSTFAHPVPIAPQSWPRVLCRKVGVETGAQLTGVDIKPFPVLGQEMQKPAVRHQHTVPTDL